MKKQDKIHQILREENAQNDTIIKLQKELIENLEDKIHLLEEENKRLDEVVKKYAEAYDSLKELCDSQQAPLNYIQNGESSEETVREKPE